MAADFQSLYAALLLLERLPNGRYPERRDMDAHALPMAEYLRRAAITGAAAQQVDLIATNSDGSPERRQRLLTLLGPDARELVIDPGIEVVRERLTFDGVLTAQCNDGINRWYTRL